MQDTKIYSEEVTVVGDRGITTKGVNGGVKPTSGSGTSITHASTITTKGCRVSRVAPTAAITDVVLEAGTLDGQEVTVINENTTGTNTITAAASGTSNIADGTAAVISGLRAMTFIWNAPKALWYHHLT